MKQVLYLSLIVIGMALLGIAITQMRVVDTQLSLRQPKQAELIGKATRPDTEIGASTIDSKTASTFTVIGAAVAVLGAANVMVGSLLTAVHLMETRASRSRLGTDIGPARGPSLAEHRA